MELEERTTLPSAGENMAGGWSGGGEVEAYDPVASHDAATRDRADIVPSACVLALLSRICHENNPERCRTCEVGGARSMNTVHHPEVFKS